MGTLITIMTCISVIPIGLTMVLTEVSCRKTKKERERLERKLNREDWILHDLTACDED